VRHGPERAGAARGVVLRRRGRPSWALVSAMRKCLVFNSGTGSRALQVQTGQLQLQSALDVQMSLRGRERGAKGALADPRAPFVVSEQRADDRFQCLERRVGPAARRLAEEQRQEAAEDVEVGRLAPR